MNDYTKLVERLKTAAFEEGILEAREYVSYSKVDKANTATRKAEQDLLTYIENLQASIPPPRSQFS